MKDSSQAFHFKSLYETMKVLNKNCIENIEFEQFYVPFGKFTNMSTRKGKIELLSDLLNEAKEVALEQMDHSKCNINFVKINSYFFIFRLLLKLKKR